MYNISIYTVICILLLVKTSRIICLYDATLIAIYKILFTLPKILRKIATCFNLNFIIWLFLQNGCSITVIFILCAVKFRTVLKLFYMKCLMEASKCTADNSE